ncbi:hypothetical protein F8388_021001 [Cannabis sativa]|nr:hypothetical protein F8388_021001 [Cannabis sativa]
MGYWKSKVLPKIKKVFEKNTAKKAEAAEACNTFDQSKFPGSKTVTEASTKYGAGLVSGPIIFVLEKVSTFVPIEEVVKEDEPKKEEEQEQVTTKVEKEIVIEEDKIQEEQPTTSTTTIAPATEEPPKAAKVVEAVEPPPPQPKQP